MRTPLTDPLTARTTVCGAQVEHVDLGERWGLYDDDARTIYLHHGLTSWQERSTLAHEASHAWHRDRPTTDPREHERRERRADADAARTLVTVAEYAAAEDEVGPDPGALAHHLGVSRWVIEAWQRAADIGRRWTLG